ncbi:MAG: hypothetical protein ACOYXT_06345 [Bacteroidota bacterium]
MENGRRKFLQTTGLATAGSLLALSAIAGRQKQSDNFLNVKASETSSENDFDFYVGKWRIQNRKLKTRLNNCQEWEEFESTDECMKILNGLGSIDHYRATFDNKPFEGLTLRLFDAKSKLWSMYWVDSERMVLDAPVVGSFENKIGKFYAKDTYEGKTILMVFHWDVSDPEVPLWKQAFSPDWGKTWEWNWYMTAHRIV